MPIPGAWFPRIAKTEDVSDKAPTKKQESRKIPAFFDAKSLHFLCKTYFFSIISG